MEWASLPSLGDRPPAGCALAAPSPGGPKVRRVLGDISNTAAAHGGGGLGLGGAQKRPVLDPHTPARRAKAFTVYEDGMDTGMSVYEDPAIGALSEARSVSARPTPNAPNRGKAAGSPSSRRLSHPGRSATLLGIDESPPEIEGFSSVDDKEASYWSAMAYDGDGMGPDAFCDRLFHTVEAVERRDAYLRGPGFGVLSPREYGATGAFASMLSPFTPAAGAEKEDGGSPWRSPFSLPSVHMDIDNLSNSGDV